MAGATDPVQPPAGDGRGFAAGGAVDAALHAAGIAVDANQRQRLVRFVCRHADLEQIAGGFGQSPSASARDFTMVLQGLARD